MKYARKIPLVLILGAALSCNVLAADAPKLVVKTGIWEWDRGTLSELDELGKLGRHRFQRSRE